MSWSPKTWVWQCPTERPREQGRVSINSSGHRFASGQQSVQRIHGVTANMEAYGAEVNNRHGDCVQLLGNSNISLSFCFASFLSYPLGFYVVLMEMETNQHEVSRSE